MARKGTAVYKNSWNDKWTASIELPWVGCRVKEAGSEQEARRLAQEMEAEEAALSAKKKRR